MSKGRARALAPRNVVSDMMDLLDAAGIDNINRNTLDSIIHSGFDLQGMLDFAGDLCRRNGVRMQFIDFLSEYTAGAQ